MAQLEPQSPSLVADQEPFWQPIGRLVFAFGHVENEIDQCISALLGVESGSGEPSVASQVRNICSRIALVEALFRQLTTDETRRGKFHALIKELGTVIKFRNGVLHGPWGAYLDDRRTWQKPRTHPVDLTPSSFEVSVEAIDAHIERAAEIGAALTRLVRDVTEERAAGLLEAP